MFWFLQMLMAISTKIESVMDHCYITRLHVGSYLYLLIINNVYQVIIETFLLQTGSKIVLDNIFKSNRSGKKNYKNSSPFCLFILNKHNMCQLDNSDFLIKQVQSKKITHDNI